MSATDDFLTHSRAYAETFPGELPAPPSRRVAVVTCMDARIDVYRLFGLREGEAHVMRNAGGVLTDDVLRSLAISQRVLGTREVVLMHHTQCGLIDFADDRFKDEIEAETGTRPTWGPQSLHDLDEDVRRAVARVKADPILPVTDAVRGFVYDVATGEVREVSEDRAAAGA